MHLNSSLSDVSVAGNGKVTGKVGSQALRFDHLIAATGYRIDLAAQPELARIHEVDRAVARPVSAERRRRERGGQRSTPISAQASSSCRATRPARNTCATFTASISRRALSFGIPVGDVPSVVDQPRLILAIARDLYRRGRRRRRAPALHQRAARGAEPGAVRTSRRDLGTRRRLHSKTSIRTGD